MQNVECKRDDSVAVRPASTSADVETESANSQEDLNVMALRDDAQDVADR